MASELKKRVLTALVLVPVVLWCVFGAADARAFQGFAAAIVVVGAWEWAALMGWQSALARTAYAALVLCLLAAVNFLPDAHQWRLPVLGLAVFFWLVAHRLVRAYPASAVYWAQATFLIPMGLVLLVPAWLGLTMIHAASAMWLLYVLLLVWGADTGAYFAGRAFGKTKLAPAVSPGKTFEGFVGGVLLTMSLAVAVTFYLGLGGQRAVAFMGLSLMTVLASVLGDLFESMVKRHAGVKDSGRIFPGHGGALDRIDSLTAAAPVFALGWMLAGGF